MALYRTRHLHTAIARPYDEVHAFLSEPGNFAQWAAGLGRGFEHDSGLDWHVDTPQGRWRVRFSAPNEHGVTDHWVTMGDGTVVHNALRVLPNGDGAEVVFTLMQRPGMDDAEFERDAAAVQADLKTLKTLLERGG